VFWPYKRSLSSVIGVVGQALGGRLQARRTLGYFPPQGGIFALLDDSVSLIIKQVQLVYESGHSTGRIRCTPSNPVYPPFELTLGEDARIIGRKRSHAFCERHQHRSRRVSSAAFSSQVFGPVQ
jgi:hypothetical protein